LEVVDEEMQKMIGELDEEWETQKKYKRNIKEVQKK
jgi:hypothetical protein